MITFNMTNRSISVSYFFPVCKYWCEIFVGLLIDVDCVALLYQVADSALRCFACLADRFTRRGVDPAPLAKHGLANVLLEKLASSAQQYSAEKQSSVPATSPDTRSNAGNVSIVVSVLSTLCRGSPSVTHVCIQPYALFERPLFCPALKEIKFVALDAMFGSEVQSSFKMI